MAEVFEPVIRIDTGDSELTVKDLKKEISTLRDEILNLEKGTEQYDTAVKRLQDDQRKLDEVMALTKRTATALDGSYDALTQQMSLLKKEWRATNDEAKRSELAKKIAEINNELKEMDAEIGNFQRNVGNYVSHWEGMEGAVADFGTQMRNTMESIEPVKAKFESVQKIAGGLASGFAAVQGAAALLNIESENLEKSLVKVQAAMALAQGIGGIGDLVEGIGQAKVAFQGFSKVLSGTGGIIAIFGALVAAVIAVVGNMDKLKQKFTGFSEADKAAVSTAKLNEELTKLSSQSSAEKIVRLKELAEGYKNLGDNVNDKKQYVKDFADELEDMGIAMTDVNDADKIFIEQTDNYINALIARAKADAIKEKATEDYKRALEEMAALETELAEQKAKQNAGTPDKTFWQNLGEAALNAGYYEGVPVDQIQDINSGWDAEIAQKNVNTAQANLDAAKAKADTDLANAFQTAAGYEAEANSYLTPRKKKKKKGGGGTPKPKTLDEILAEIQQQIYEDTINMVIEDIPIDITDSGSKSGGYQYKDGDAEKRYGWWNSLIDNETSNAVRRSKLDGGTPEEQDALIIAGEERKLAKLKEFWEQAKSEGDVTGQIALRQQIADQELTIEEEKNRAILESEERTKEKRLKIMGEISNALSAAGSLTQGILEITQAAAEKDGKITEKEAKRIKGMQYATASINMLQGAISAYAAAQTIPPPLGPILGGVNAAAVIAMGTANLMRIKNTDITGEVSSGAMGAVTPSSNVYGTDIPFSYTRNITSASEVDKLNQDTKVYVLESDITNAVNKQKVRVEESSF